MNQIQEQIPVSVSLVADDNRLDFLPTFFTPRLMMRGEALVYAWMSRLSGDYKGGYWHFYALSNGGFYLAPALESPMRVAVAGNWFEGELSADAAGVVATLFALGQLAADVQGTEAGDVLIDRYYFLRDFAAEHAEGPAIFRAID
jgi:hypothetical protein